MYVFAYICHCRSKALRIIKQILEIKALFVNNKVERNLI